MLSLEFDFFLTVGEQEICLTIKTTEYSYNRVAPGFGYQKNLAEQHCSGPTLHQNIFYRVAAGIEARVMVGFLFGMIRWTSINIFNLKNSNFAKNKADMKIKYHYWQEDDFWLGYIEEYPDYMTQGETLEELKENLKDIYRDLKGGKIPAVRKSGELEIA